MVPTVYDGKMINRITVNGEDVPASIKQIKGAGYAFITVESGESHEISIDYTQ
jgi:hypothetical protein